MGLPLWTAYRLLREAGCRAPRRPGDVLARCAVCPLRSEEAGIVRRLIGRAGRRRRLALARVPFSPGMSQRDFVLQLADEGRHLRMRARSACRPRSADT